MQEGSVWEALMAISHRKLDNIVVIVDKNNLQIDGSCDDVKSLGNLDKKLEAFGFDVQQWTDIPKKLSPKHFWRQRLQINRLQLLQIRLKAREFPLWKIMQAGMARRQRILNFRLQWRRLNNGA